ncbi:hypothetical protein P170DRAFT_473958 [Aspergillus steynii IBT 23096]|uniref:Uncharacterized protein n=1 Tax=Aspergillus steynii IBT 23096 TaxID=1392250 RepID=A0A2I2GBZ6_9EURO|nr:uncharacterized protein P170DRAFT_473958 [Aspergillus steynii IBT 23096]PLB50401.1 hypothetical protein P170DRAFT_473958 [Aspergillus steynii IBT 23096]
MQLLTFSALATAFLAVFAAANPVELEKKEAEPNRGYYAEEYYRRPAAYYGPPAGAGIGIGANADAAADAHVGLEMRVSWPWAAELLGVVG